MFDLHLVSSFGRTVKNVVQHSFNTSTCVIGNSCTQTFI